MEIDNKCQLLGQIVLAVIQSRGGALHADADHLDVHIASYGPDPRYEHLGDDLLRLNAEMSVNAKDITPDSVATVYEMLGIEPSEETKSPGTTK